METSRLDQTHGNGSKSNVAQASRRKDLLRIEAALTAATSLLEGFRSGLVKAEVKEGGDPVTAADRAVNQLLFQLLPRNEEGWLSEETADDPSRLAKRRVWVVDPLDGTKEFLAGIPEWCVSIGLVEDGEAVAGGICNPATGEVFCGSLETGVTVLGPQRPVLARLEGEKALVLASRSEVNRGEWNWLQDSPFSIRPVGAIAYKLALVAAGLAEATWTFVPKHEWDVAAGTALVLAGGGVVRTLQNQPPIFNRSEPLLEGLIAVSAKGQKLCGELFEDWVSRGRKIHI